MVKNTKKATSAQNSNLQNKYAKKIFKAFIATLVGGIIYVNYDYVVDGDTLRVHGRSVRLFAIDAPEKKQLCYKDALSWECGIQAKEVLIEIISDKKITCIPKTKDKYKRTVAICFAGTTEINREMVKRGFALPMIEHGGKDYLSDAEYAKKNHLGIWQGTFERPSEWRKAQKK